MTTTKAQEPIVTASGCIVTAAWNSKGQRCPVKARHMPWSRTEKEFTVWEA